MNTDPTSGSDVATTSLDEWLHVGLVQTTLDARAAWTNCARISALEQERAWEEIITALVTFRNEKTAPNVVLIPELSVPRPYFTRLRALARNAGFVVIAGVDYKQEVIRGQRVVRNEAVMIAPNRWAESGRSSRCAIFPIGKTYPAPREEEKLRSVGCGFVRDPVFWLFDAGRYGSFAICVCYDLMDVERWVLYRGMVQHVFVVAYNKDIGSFYHLAEALSRTLLCNVVVCNTGFYGGSVVVSPYYEPYLRTVYRHEGNGLLTYQVVRIPVRALCEAQRSVPGPLVDLRPAEKPKLFKSQPPGMAGHVPLSRRLRRL
jgi:hypothetical protein